MLEVEGYLLHPNVFTRTEMEQLALNLRPVSRAGVRSLLDDEDVRGVARDPRLRALLGADFFAVRAVLFDKTAASNWGLQWHQDLSVAVCERRETAGFSAWTEKAGVVHALAPVGLLERMVCLRIHVDDCGLDAGPLRVVPRSHLRGRLDADAVRGEGGEHEHVCAASCGDVLAFKPLLLHASASSTCEHHRRVLQLEFARDELPGGLRWRWRV